MVMQYWKTMFSIFIALSLTFCIGGCALFVPNVDTETYERPDGTIVVESLQLTATVTAVNERARTVTIDPKWGKQRTIKASSGMTNFEQIQVGDKVHADVIEEFAVSLIPGGSPESVGELDAVALAPAGEKPAIGAVSSREVTADIIAIDAHAHSITLELIDGTTQSIKVGKHIDLTQFGLGDSVRVQVTDAVFIDFEKVRK
jgi:hypothetical protein